MARTAGQTRLTLSALLAAHPKEATAIGIAVALAVLAIAAPPGTLRTVLVAAGLGAGIAFLVVATAEMIRSARNKAQLDGIASFFAKDGAVHLVTDPDGIIQSCNEATKRQLGVSNGDPLANGLRRVFASPEHRVEEMMDRARNTGSVSLDRVSHNGLVRLTATMAPRRYISWRIENLSSNSATVGVGEIGLPVLVAGQSGKIIGQNAAMSDYLGMSFTTLEEAFGTSDLTSGRMAQVQTRQGPRQVRLAVVESPDTGCREIFVLPEDLDDSADAQKLFESLPVPMLKLTVDGQIIWVNHGARALVGRDVPQGTKLHDLVSGLGRPVSDWLRDACSDAAPAQSEFIQVRGDERHRFIQVSLKRGEELGEPALLAVLSDATELKTLEAQFVQSQKMQAIGQLAGGVAHDFNNLLTAISGHCDLLLLRHDEGDPAYADLIQINQNANRAASLVGQLLAFSRKQTLRLEVVDLRDALSDLTHLLSRLVWERIRLTLRHDDQVPAIRADKRQLEQVIMNLVVNARDAMPEGGEILVTTSSVVLDQELCRNRAVIPAGTYAVVRVQDEGTGIPANQLQKVFEPFFTTKKTGEGTGLGLSTAYGIIKQSGGFIFADSTPGVSTVFTIYFPAFNGDQVEPVVQSTEPVAPSADRRDGVVLLVEDEAPVRAFASRALRLRGLTVIEAESAEEALELLEDPDLHVDVFVTDVVMPGMDGPNWVRRARRDRPDTRVIFVSGYAEDALSDHETKIPNSVFLPKPFSLEALTNTVQDQLQQS